MTRVGIVGAGRAGCGVGAALAHAGIDVILHSRERHALPVSLEHTSGPSVPWLAERPLVLLAVPDDSVPTVAAELAASGVISPRHVILHLSGSSGVEVLESLRGTGAALGAFHPFQTLADPVAAPARLRGAVAAVSGDARAVAAARELAHAVGLRVVQIPDAGRVAYHAAAVFASNYVVVLARVAASLLAATGLSESEVRQALQRIIEGAAANIGSTGVSAALTGPVVRGDVKTLERHLAAVPATWQALYRELVRAALDMTDHPAERRQEILDLVDRA